jgi:hypothetical protein
MEIAHTGPTAAAKLVEQTGLRPVEYPPALPFPPGKSPFEVKGSYYKELQDRLVDWDGIMNSVDDAAVRDFGRQRFLASEWYDYMPVLFMARGLGVYLGCPADEAITEQAIRNAKRQVSGIYKFVLSFTSPELGMRRMRSVYRQIYNFGRCDITISGNTAVASYHQWPAMMAWLYQVTTDAWVGTLLKVSGATRITRDWAEPVPDGIRDGVELVKLEVRTTWTR